MVEKMKCRRTRIEAHCVNSKKLLFFNRKISFYELCNISTAFSVVRRWVLVGVLLYGKYAGIVPSRKMCLSRFQTCFHVLSQSQFFRGNRALIDVNNFQFFQALRFMRGRNLIRLWPPFCPADFIVWAGVAVPWPVRCAPMASQLPRFTNDTYSI